jgi:hypothetical protein
MKEKFRTPGQLEAKKLQQAAWVKRKTEQRIREKAAEDIYVRSQNRETFWNYNRSQLSPEELQALESKQAEFLEYFGIVDELIEKLNIGAVIGEPSGLPYPDIAYQETKEYILRTSGTRLMFHPSEEQIANLHHPDSDPRILKAFHDADPNYFMYGYFTLFTYACWFEFLSAVAKYIKENPDPNFDQAIAAQILIEHQGHVPVPVLVVPQPAPISEAERVERAIRANLNAGTPPPDWQL